MSREKAQWPGWKVFLPWVFARRLGNAIRWVRAGQLSSARRFEEALRVARSMNDDDFKQSYLWAAFEIQQLALLRWDHETIDRANDYLFKWGLSTAKTENGRYVITYVRWCGSMAFANYAPGSPMPSSFEFDASKIDLRAVGADLKRNFPLTIHPAWSKTSPFYGRGRYAGPAVPRKPIT
jgi:hypothetical protein